MIHRFRVDGQRFALSLHKKAIKDYTIMLTRAEIEYMAKTTASLRNIEKQLGRIADALEKTAGTSNEPLNEETV